MFPIPARFPTSKGFAIPAGFPIPDGSQSLAGPWISGTVPARRLVNAPVVISLGSNLDAESHLRKALDLLARRFELVASSRCYRSPAVGSSGSPPFYNIAVQIVTDLAPMQLKLDVLRPIEASLGRVRGEDRNAPRTIDLDITLVGNLVVEDLDLDLHLPDPEILTQPYVAVPLAEILPLFVHPVAGLSMAEIVAGFGPASEIEVVDGWGL